MGIYLLNDLSSSFFLFYFKKITILSDHLKEVQPEITSKKERDQKDNMK